MERHSLIHDRKTQYCQDASLPNLVYRFEAILVKIWASFFVNIDRYSKVYMEKWKTQES